MAQATVTVSDVLDNARALLNDLTSIHYDNLQLLPYLKIAYRDMSNRMIRRGIQYTKETYVVASLDKGTQEIDVPADLIVPVNLRMREQNGRWFKVPAGEEITEPLGGDVEQFPSWWVWREGVIILSSPLSTTLEAYLRYRRAFAPLENEDSPIEIPNAETYLASMTAALVAQFAMQDPRSAAAAKALAEEEWNDIAAIEINAKQSRPFRRRTGSYSRGRGLYGRYRSSRGLHIGG